jgi:1,4-dihydroxy-2-naphthoate polyprenyltransferase
LANQILTVLRGGWILLRSIAVIFSSVATIISSLLPLFLNNAMPLGNMLMLFAFLTIAAFIIHGVLTHALNDYTDFHSGTDEFSPAILSGGSRVVQNGIMSLDNLRQLGKGLTISLLIIAGLLALFAQYELAILLLIGIWSAASYSLPPLRLSYRPFLGEWLSLFPAILFLGFAGPWIVLGSIPLWTLQNAVINALFCMAWVMVHHIPDLEADKRAVPMKRTSVVWFADRFGLFYARFPALIYLFAALFCGLWLGFDRFWAAACLVLTIAIALFFVMKVDVMNYQQVTVCEKILLSLAMITAISLGIFV